MRAVITSLVLAAAIIATSILPPSARADLLDPGPDGIGIYATKLADKNTIEVEPGEIFTLAIVATGLTSEHFSAWELSIAIEGDPILVDRQFPPEAISFAPWPRFVVGYYVTAPLPEALYLGSIMLMSPSGEPAELFIGHCDWFGPGGSMGNSMPCYAIGPPDHSLKVLNPSSGAVDRPVFAVNADGPVDAQPATWSSVKAVFR